MKIDLIYGTASPPGRLSKALKVFERALLSSGDIESATIDLSAMKLPPAGSMAPADYPADVQRTLESIAGAQAVVVFSPVFRAAAPGTLKNLFDLLPVEALESKPVGTVAMGASPHHFLAVDMDLQPILAWFGAIALPAGPYLTSRSFDSGVLIPEAESGLSAYARSVTEVAKRLQGIELLPRPLAAAARG